MPDVSPDNLRLALAATAGLLVLFVLRQALTQWLRRRRILHRIVEARKGESRARGLLEEQGYSVVATQFGCSYTLCIDGEDLVIPLRADYIVARDGRRYVAEVKTGAAAPYLRTPSTRRQLLEYRMAFDVDGVLLVNAEQDRIHTVRFPILERTATDRLAPLRWMAIVAMVALLLATQWR